MVGANNDNDNNDDDAFYLKVHFKALKETLHGTHNTTTVHQTIQIR